MDYRNETPYWSAAGSQAASYDAGLRGYLLGVYNYMASALVLTGITAYLGSSWLPLMQMLYKVQDGHMALTGLGWLVFFAPIAMALGLSMGINRLSVNAARGIFWAYAGVMGLSLSAIFFTYTGESLMRVFLITAIMFGGMSIWGYSTKKDLTGMGNFLMMGLLGIVVASLVNIFLGSSGLHFAVSVLGVVIFTGLIAYDTQKLKSMYYMTAGDSTAAAKGSILGALELYLDFVNLFIMLLRLVGERR